jgi:hypothetical protein
MRKIGNLCPIALELNGLHTTHGRHKYILELGM